jgi:CubicO group peptidase (beta-lactamase class C family)
MAGSTIPPPDRLIRTLEQTVPTVLVHHAVPGLAMALAQHGTTIWSRGFGLSSMATHQPVSSATIFEAGSLSKPLVAYAALSLCDRGILHLDRPLTTYLPTPYLPNEPALAQITLRHVLSHTTGFPNWRAADQPLQVRWEPGTRFGYSGEGYCYLQHVIEYLTQQPFAAFMQTAVLDTLQMSSSSFIWREAFAPDVAQGHEADGSVIEKWHPQEANAAYSLHTTVGDFAGFMSAVLNAWHPTADVSSEMAISAMLTPQISVQDSLTWGQGWGLHHDGTGMSFWQWGDNTWFTSFAVAWPEQDMSLVILTNSVYGLQACQDSIRAASGYQHPAFGWIDAFYNTI